jgi:acyl-homoserine-lactone acylase
MSGTSLSALATKFHPARLILLAAALALTPTSLLAETPRSDASGDLTRWKGEAANVTIIRDDWGIAHVTGKTDADAVFGMIYAQAEDDFNRVETNYLNSMGRSPRPKAKQDLAGPADETLHRSR